MRAGRAPDQRPQVDLGPHALAQQPAIGLVVRLLDHLAEGRVDHLLHGPPVLQRQPGRAPAVDHDASHHVRPQCVATVEFLASLQAGHASPQIRELPRGLVHHGQRQARAEDFHLDGVIVDQLQRVAAAAHAGRRRRSERRPATRGADARHGAQAVDQRLLPLRCRSGQIDGRVHALVRQLRFGLLVCQSVGAVEHPLHRGRHREQQRLHVHPPRLSGQGGWGGWGGHGG